MRGNAGSHADCIDRDTRRGFPAPYLIAHALRTIRYVLLTY